MKTVELLGSDRFDGDVSRDKLLAYFMGCALTGLCKSQDIDKLGDIMVASATASIAKACYQMYEDIMKEDDMTIDEIVRLVKDGIDRLEVMEGRNRSEDELLMNLKRLVGDYERRKGNR